MEELTETEVSELVGEEDETVPYKERMILEDPVSYIAKGELKRRMAIVPYLDDSKIMGSLYQPNVGFFEPVGMAKEFVDRAEKHGARFHEYSEVNEIVKKGNEIEGLVVNGEFKEVDGKGKISFPLRKDLDGDTHLVANIDDELKIDFNEKDLNIFLKETGDLFRLRRNIILKMTKELYKEGDAKGF